METFQFTDTDYYTVEAALPGRWLGSDIERLGAYPSHVLKVLDDGKFVIYSLIAEGPGANGFEWASWVVSSEEVDAQAAADWFDNAAGCKHYTAALDAGLDIVCPSD